ncbi:MAG: FimV/HubP family polar landmark protein, partial [Halioglobus sp.]|nr:FimV/HubP family polar landmark protein [Halioglobus sp.]
MGRKFAAVVFSLGCLQASSALALGLGELKLQSFLNEPLKASVDLLNTAGMHEDEIKVRLGTREDFKRLGIDRAFFLTSIEFEVIKDDGGKARIVMTTDDPVIEPYLDFIIEARWPSGRLLREYTVLIDPPAFSTATPVVSASQRVEEVEGIPAPAKKKDAVAGKGTRVDVRKKSTLGPGEMPERDFNAEAAGSPAAGARYMIKRDDTLWTIASRAKPAGTSVHQTMLDIQRLNPDAFINNNINRVKAGYIIYLPTADDISSADLEAALTEVREQNAAWREGRDAERAARGPSLRIAVDSEDEEAPPPADAAVAKRESELTELEDDLDRSEMERADAQGRLAAMEDRVGTLERIVDLKDEQIAALQAALAEAQSQAAADPAAMADDTADALVDDVADDMAEAMPADAA